MDVREVLKNYGKKNITIEELASLLRFTLTDAKTAYEMIEQLTKNAVIEEVKASGKNGNISYTQTNI